MVMKAVQDVLLLPVSRKACASCEILPQLAFEARSAIQAKTGQSGSLADKMILLCLMD